MTALDLTADAEEYREIAADWHGGQASALYAYASSGTIVPGLSMEIRRAMTENRTYGGSGTKVANAYNLGRLLGHIAPMEDRLNEQRACDESPSGWHEFVVDTCCHCDQKQGGSE